MFLRQSIYSMIKHSLKIHHHQHDPIWGLGNTKTISIFTVVKECICKKACRLILGDVEFEMFVKLGVDKFQSRQMGGRVRLKVQGRCGGQA